MDNKIVTKFFTIEEHDLLNARKLDRTTDLKEKWYGMNSTDNWGCATYLYKKYKYPISYKEFYDCYVTDTDKEGKTIKEYGRNEDFIMKYAKILGKRDNNRFTDKEYYCYILKKLILDTLDGCEMEGKLNALIQSKGFQTNSPTIYEDVTYGIDIKVYKDNVLKFLIQCKPNTFFFGDRNQSLMNDRKKALIKEQKAVEKYGVPVYYCVYDKATKNWIRNIGKSICFKLKQLINMDGTTKN